MTKTNEWVVWTWAGWEPAQFYRRLGGFHEAQEGNALWADDWFRRLESADTARALAEAGINWVTTHFYKGFGLVSEQEAMAATGRLITNYHRHGIKVFTYIQYGTIMPETLTAEVPESEHWRRHDWNGRHDGHPYEYGDQYWRAKPCANQPGFLDYLCRVIDAAIDTGADGIWIDNLNADGCHCTACQAAFRVFLARTIPDPWRDLGVRDVARLAIPRAERPRDPVFQAWVRFRCEEVRASLTRLCLHARARKPDVVLAANIGLGNHQRHTIENGNWLGELAVLDFTYAENSRFPAWRDGQIVSQHWPMSVANSVGVRVVPGAGFGSGSRLYSRPAVPAGTQLRRCFAESAMHGGHAFGGPWGLRAEDGGGMPVLLRDAAWRQSHRQLVEWYRTHQYLFSGSVEAAPVVILESFDASIGDEESRRRVRDAMEQLLLQARIPFRYGLSDRLGDLAEISLLILPHVLPVSDNLANQIRAFVERGGKVLATGRTSLYDEWMRQRTDYALADVFGVRYSTDFEDMHHDALLQNPANGCLFLPGAWGLTLCDGTPACRVSRDHLVCAIRTTLPADMPEVLTPVSHVVSSLRRLPDGMRVLALLNYAADPVSGITVTLASQTAPVVRAWSPAQPDAATLSVQPADSGRWQIRLPAVEVEYYLLLDDSNR